jgi:phospholipid-translocating ATPase
MVDPLTSNSHAGPSTSPSRPTPHARAPSHSYLDDSDDDVFDPSSIDPALRLRTTKTAHSVIAESLRSDALMQTRKKRRLFRGLTRKGTSISKARASLRKSSKGNVVPGTEFGDDEPGVGASTLDRREPEGVEETKSTVVPEISGAARRTIYVNLPLPPNEVHSSGEPTTRYVRNKVRTSKYTVVTFIPKNLFEQFRRVANIYFLALVVLQVFSIFGATTPQIAMLPLVAILGMTAIKDGVEDYRRAKLDEEVNNSAAAKLGGWRNVNQPRDGRSLFERIFNLGQSKLSLWIAAEIILLTNW